jgi:hypothetical protein
LVYTADTFANFELKLQYKIRSGNSGIQYRSRITNEATFGVGGYQADLEAGTDYTGLLYELEGRGFLAMRGENVTISSDGSKSVSGVGMSSAELQASVLPLQWNNYTVLANGRRVQHIINGKVFSECMDLTPSVPLAGRIALQLHDAMIMRVEFREILLRKLPISGASLWMPRYLTFLHAIVIALWVALCWCVDIFYREDFSTCNLRESKLEVFFVIHDSFRLLFWALGRTPISSCPTF